MQPFRAFLFVGKTQRMYWTLTLLNFFSKNACETKGLILSFPFENSYGIDFSIDNSINILGKSKHKVIP